MVKKVRKVGVGKAKASSGTKKRPKIKQVLKRKPRRQLNVLESSFVRWAVDRDNSVCMAFDFLAAAMLVYGLWYNNLYFVASAIVATFFGHTYARSRKK